MKSRSWESIVRFYDGFAAGNSDHAPFAFFASQVETSEYARALFPTTSMLTLYIAQVAEFERRHEVLEIDFNGETQQFQFQYWEHPNVERRWIRTCAAPDAYDTFQRFLKLRKWFT